MYNLLLPLSRNTYVICDEMYYQKLDFLRSTFFTAVN